MDDKKLQDLWDIEEVKKVQYAYTYYIDSMNLEGVMSLFTNDAIGEFNVVDGGEPKGLDGIRQFMEGATAGGWMAHQMISPYIVLDGNKASCMLYLMYIRISPPEAPPGQLTWMQGWYNNECVKVGGEWKIKHLRFTAQASGTLSGALLPQPWGTFEFPPPFTYPPPK